MNARAPPLRSNPVFILVAGISSTEISLIISLVYKFIISRFFVLIVNFCVSFKSRLLSDANAVE